MVLREWLLSECEFCEALMVLVLHTVLVWWRRLAGKNNLIWALIHDMQMIRLWLANSTVHLSNKTAINTIQAACTRQPRSTVVPRGGSSFSIQLPCSSRVNVEIVVMSFLGQEMQRWFVIATNSTGTNSIPSSCGPSQATVGEAMNTDSPTDVSWWGFSDQIVCASIFFAGNRGKITFSCSACICNSEWPIIFQKEE